MSDGCLNCGKPVSRPKYNKYCSYECKGIAMKKVKEPKICPYCSKSFLYSYANKDQIFCSRHCRQENDRKGCLGTDGYIYIGYGGKLYMQHRYVMEQHIGRPLLTSEIVHHKDHNKQNNAIDNLIIVGSHAEHVRLHHPRIITETHAECLGCHEIKPYSDYYAQSKRSTGILARCKKCCHKAYVDDRIKKGLPTSG